MEMINSAIAWWSTIDGQVVFAVIVAVVFTVAFFWSKYQIRKLDREIAEILDRANARRSAGGGGGGGQQRIDQPTLPVKVNRH